MAQAKGQFRSQRQDVNGWLILDKPLGVTSTQAVSRVKRIFNAKKAGHAGTLDPLASGLLPIAFGEATKTVPFVQDGIKAYRFAVQWGSETNTDDTEGVVTRHSDKRPTPDAIEAALPLFVGTIMQRPPAFSAIKINGERAYDVARDGEDVVLKERPITIHSLTMIASDDECSTFEAICGKGTYVRALARDLGIHLGCFGHVQSLRRTRVGPFIEIDGVSLTLLEQDGIDPHAYMRSVEAGLIDLPCVLVDREGAQRLRRGQSLILRGRDAPLEGYVYAVHAGVPIAFGSVERGALVPQRVFNMPF
jgi:tRNA pseudouridine55 synthase